MTQSGIFMELIWEPLKQVAIQAIFGLLVTCLARLQQTGQSAPELQSAGFMEMKTRVSASCKIHKGPK